MQRVPSKSVHVQWISSELPDERAEPSLGSAGSVYFTGEQLVQLQGQHTPCLPAHQEGKTAPNVRVQHQEPAAPRALNSWLGRWGLRRQFKSQDPLPAHVEKTRRTPPPRGGPQLSMAPERKEGRHAERGQPAALHHAVRRVAQQHTEEHVRHVVPAQHDP